MKVIKKLEEYKSRIKVYIDDEEPFVLYKGDVRKFHLEEKLAISNEAYNEIYTVLFKRAKERALYILDDAYKTEHQIREKLKSGFYPEIIINNVIDFLKKYDMVNDLRFANLFIEYKGSSKSKKQIIQDLYVKGVPKDIINIAFEESDYSDDYSLNKIVEKKIKRYNMNEKTDVQKFYRYLVSKGYNYNSVKKVLEKYTNQDLY